MQPRITVITLAVEDLGRAVAFYRDGLGWPTEGIVGTELEHGAVAFFDLAGGTKLAVWPRESLRHDLGAAAGPAERGGAWGSLGHNVASSDEVDDVMRHAIAAGASVLKPPQPTSWGGYSGYFADPDGHVWEVVYNPHLLPAT